MTRTPALVLLSLALATGPATAQSSDGFAAELFPPELVMQHQRQLGLTADQRTTITDAIKTLQTTAVDLQWRMQDEQQRLAELLGRPSVDEAAALAQIDRLLEIEARVKRAHLAMLIRIKNALTPEQQTRLRGLRGTVRDSLRA